MVKLYVSSEFVAKRIKRVTGLYYEGAFICLQDAFVTADVGYSNYIYLSTSFGDIRLREGMRITFSSDDSTHVILITESNDTDDDLASELID